MSLFSQHRYLNYIAILPCVNFCDSASDSSEMPFFCFVYMLTYKVCCHQRLLTFWLGLLPTRTGCGNSIGAPSITYSFVVERATILLPHPVRTPRPELLKSQVVHKLCEWRPLSRIMVLGKIASLLFLAVEFTEILGFLVSYIIGSSEVNRGKLQPICCLYY